MTTLFYVELCL